jgi:glutathione S-transferase
MPPAARNRTEAPYQLHGFEVSYFTAKVRPALRYKGVWVDERRADVRKILEMTGLGFIPVVVTPEGEVWQDSTDIYQHLEARHPQPPLYPSSAVQRVAGQLVELYADEIGLIPAMHYRWASELGEASARARFSAMIGSAELGHKAADRMVKARHVVGAAPSAAAEIEAHTHDLLDALSAHFEAHPFLLGGRASFADCALMGPIDGHLFNDLVSRRLLLERAFRVVAWIERGRYPNEDEQTEWLEDDALAATFVDVLRVMGRDGAESFLDSVRAVEAWADQRASGERALPRGLPPITTRFRGHEIEKVPQGYSLYSLQQLQAVLRALSEDERRRVDAALAGTGFEAVLDHEPRHPVEKDGFELVFSS